MNSVLGLKQNASKNEHYKISVRAYLAVAYPGVLKNVLMAKIKPLLSVKILVMMRPGARYGSGAGYRPGAGHGSGAGYPESDRTLEQF